MIIKKLAGNQKKLAALLLSIILFMTCFSIPSSSLEKVISNEIETVEKSSINEEPMILEEDTSKRGEFEKHFLLSNGDYIACTYDEPVHIKEGNTWIEIDNTLKAVKSTDGSNRLENQNGIFDISFAKTPTDKLVIMEKNGHTISWDLQMIKDTSLLSVPTDNISSFAHNETIVTNSAQRLEIDGAVNAKIKEIYYSNLDTEELKTAAIISTSKLSYEKAWGNNIDINYFILPTRVKEEIVLNHPQDFTAYSMTVTTDLDVRLLDNRQIEFYKKDEIVFTMWAPYMYDAAGSLSEDIAVELSHNENGTYIITVTPDSNWLNDSEREYPIVLDPDITVSQEKTNGLDNFVWEGQSTTVQDYNKDRTYIGGYRSSSTSTRYKARTFQKFDVMPSIPSGSTITAATQTFKITSGTSTGAYASAYRVTGADWSSKTITWSNQPSASTSISISGNNIGQNGNFSELKLNMLSTVQTWYNGSTNGKNNNYGIMLRYQTETSLSDYNALYSADFGTTASRPKLTITYSTSSTSITITGGSTSLSVGNNTTWTANVTNGSGTTVWSIVSSSPANIVTLSGSGNTRTITANGVGTVTIKATNNGKSAQRTITCTTTNALADGIYYIKNVRSGLYLDVPNSSGSGTQCVQYAFNGGINQQWQVKNIGNNTYTIKPVHSPASALDVIGGSPNNDAPVGIYTANNPPQSSIQWEIVYVSSVLSIAKYRLMSVVSGRTKGLAVHSASMDEGASCIQFTYNGTQNDEWIFEKVFSLVANKSGDVNGFVYESFLDNYVSKGFKAWKRTDISSAEALQSLRSGDIVIFGAHGTQTSIKCLNGQLTRDHIINNLSDTELRNTRLVVYAACSTGEGGIAADNLVNATFDKGAQCVIGFQDIVTSPQMWTWLQAFMSAIAGQPGGSRYTIAAAMIYADGVVDDVHCGHLNNRGRGGTDNRLVRGTTNVFVDN